MRYLSKAPTLVGSAKYFELTSNRLSSELLNFTDVGASFRAHKFHKITSGYATWFTAGGAIRIAHYDVIDDVITRKL